MSTLDIVLHRQGPAPSGAKMGGDASGADADGGRANDAFSSLLSDQKRSAAAARGQIEQKRDPEPASDLAADAEADAPDVAATAATAQSEEMLSLLESLMSSAAISDDAELGAGGAQTAESQVPDGDETIEPDATADDASSAAPGTAQAHEGGFVAKPSGAAEMEPLARAAALQEPSPVKIAAQPAAAVALAAIAPGQATAASAAAQPSASGRAGQGAQTQADPQPDSAARGPEKASGEDRETLRTLGTAGEPSTGSGSKNTGAEDRLAGSGRKSATAARPAEEPLSAKAGAVEVIDSRRFLPAQTLTGNAQMLTRSLIEAGDAALAAQRTAQAQAAAAAQPPTGQMLHTLKLQLNPIALGSVTAVLKLTGDELSVSIKVETAEAYRQLSDDNQSILKAMRAQGYAVEQITVQHVPTGDRPGNPGQQQGFQGNFQGSGAGDAQSSDRGSDGRSTGQQGANQHGGQGREQNPYSVSGSERSDGVYL